jgi:hypothetical protein
MDEKRTRNTKRDRPSDRVAHSFDKPTLSIEYLTTIAHQNGLVRTCEACGSEMTEPAAVANCMIELHDLDHRESRKMHLTAVRLLLQGPLKTINPIDRARCIVCRPSHEALWD